MSDLKFDLKKQIKTTAVADAALARVVANVRASSRVKWKDGRATQEAVYNATWLWLEDMPEEEVEEAMSRYIPRLEALMRGEQPDDTPPSRRTGKTRVLKRGDDVGGGEKRGAG